MKNGLFGFAMIAVLNASFAQEAADKNIQAGLVVGVGMNFQQMNTKLMQTNGVGSDLTIGANAIFSFTETIGFNTGVEFDFETIKFKAGADPVYYDYEDAKILTSDETNYGESGHEVYQLTTRKQQPIYLTIPTMLVFRTNFIGYFRYFGKFGLRNSFLLANKITDEGYNYPLDANPVFESGLIESSKNENMTTSKNEMIFFKSAVGLAGGAEWNFVGSTCLTAELGYYYGFMPLFWDRDNKDRTLYTTDALGTNNSYFSNLAKQSQLMLKVSILF